MRTACKFFAVPLFTVSLLAGCATTPESYLVRPAFRDAPRAVLEQSLLLLPVRVQAVELDASGKAHPQPEIARTLAESLEDEIREIGDRSAGVKVLDLPSLTEDEQRILDEHLALLHVIARTTAGAHLSREEEWADVVADLDYSIGDGLRFLRTRTGAKHALVVSGGMARSSGGRVALSTVAAIIPSLLVPGMIFVPMGPYSTSYLVAAVVDLESGDLLWLHPGDGRYRRLVDMTSEKGARRTIRAMLGAPYSQEKVTMGAMN